MFMSQVYYGSTEIAVGSTTGWSKMLRKVRCHHGPHGGFVQLGGILGAGARKVNKGTTEHTYSAIWVNKAFSNVGPIKMCYYRKLSSNINYIIHSNT